MGRVKLTSASRGKTCAIFCVGEHTSYRRPGHNLSQVSVVSVCVESKRVVRIGLYTHWEKKDKIYNGCSG